MHALRDLITSHAGHANITNNQIGNRLRHFNQRIRPASRGGDIETLRTQTPFERSQKPGFIINH